MSKREKTRSRRGESMYNLFSARSVPSLERLESYVQVRHRPVIGTSDEAIPVGSTEDTRRLKKAGSSKQLDNVRSSQSRHTRESGELGRRLKNRRKPKQLSDLDVHTSRAPLIFQINLLEWIWLHSKSRLRILILAILFCFIIVNAVVAIWLFVAGEHVENPNICKTVACKNLRNRIVATLNRSVKPCDDFYAFVCGSSEVSHDLPEEENRFWHYGNDAARVDYNFSRSISLKRMLVNTDKFPYDIILSTYRACLQKDEREKQGVQPYYELLKKLNLYDVSKDKALTGANVVDSIGRILGYHMIQSAIITVRYNFDSLDEKIQARIIPYAGDVYDSNNVYRYGYQLYYDTIRKAFEFLDELNLTGSELDIVAHDIVCLELYLRDEHISNKETVLELAFKPDKLDSKGRPECEVGGAWTGSNPKANFGQPGSGSVDYELLMKTIYAVANPEWNLASDPMPPELDILEPQKNKRTNKEFLKIFEEIFQQSAPIRLLRYLQWRVLQYTALELDDKILDIMINVKRHVYLGEIQNCFRALFQEFLFLPADAYINANSQYGTDIVDEEYIEETDNIQSVFQRMVLGSKFEDFQKFIGKKLPDRDMVLFRTILLSNLRIDDISPTLFRGINYPGYEELYRDLSITRNNHFWNLIIMGQRTNQWHINSSFYEKYWSLEPTFRTHIYMDISRNKARTGRKHFWRVYLPLASVEAPFFRDGLTVSDYGGLGAIVSNANQKAFSISLRKESSYRYLMKKMPLEYNNSEIRDMQKSLRLYVEDYDSKILSSLKSWKMGKLIVDNLKYETSMKRILSTIWDDISRYQVLAALVNEFLANPANKKESRKVLQHLEEFSAKQLFYIALVARRCKNFGPEEFDHVSKYGPLPQSVRNNVGISNLYDFAKTFDCPANSPMNPSEKINFWDKDVDVSAYDRKLPPEYSYIEQGFEKVRGNDQKENVDS